MLNVYRRLLRLYPAAYRREFADEMLDVIAEARSEVIRENIINQSIFTFREVLGLVTGALTEHLRIADWRDFKFSFPRKEFIMRNGFRFPKATVVFMMLILGGVLMAIKKGGDIARSLPDVNPQIAPIQPSHWALVPPVVLLWMFFCALGLVGWVVLFGLRKSGMHRLERMSGGRE
ncbi:MAG TPA: hypothetical protein VMP68_07015 [Candidatus Eisenbacteria bacterium]|nr:hypothetical protein [Candidatus Eisenbacteria bacterium]